MGVGKMLTRQAEAKALGALVLGISVVVGLFIFKRPLVTKQPLITVGAVVALLFLVRRIAGGGRFRIPSGLSLANQVVIVTGGNTGIGLESAITFAKLGATVILGCRDPSRAANAVATIKKRSESSKVEALPLDLSSLASVREFVATFKGKYSQLNILLNNAGVMMCPYGLTKDGHETQFGTNHIGHFLLSIMLAPMIVASKGRVVNVSSFGHSLCKKIDVQLNLHKATYDPVEAYGQSKLANILMAKELQRRFEGTGATAYALHPGYVATELTRHFSGFMNLMALPFQMLLAKNPKQGAQTSLYCSLSPKAVPGGYHVDCRESPCMASARDENAAKALWDYSTKAVGMDWKGR